MISDTDAQPDLFHLRTERPRFVLHAIVGMWAGVLIGQAFNIFQAFYGSEHADTGAVLFSCAILAATIGVQRQLSAAREWARMAYLLLLVLSYSLMALDDAGITHLDMISLVLTVPINLYVLLSLYGVGASHWFLGPDNNAL